MRKFVLAVVVLAVVTLACNLIGSILAGLNLGSVVVAIGQFLVKYAAGLGALAGLWYYFK